MTKPSRTEILQRVRDLVGGDRIVRWADARTTIGTYEGCEWTIDVFDVPASETFALGRRIGPYRRELSREHRIGLNVIPHSPEATDRHYAWVRAEADAQAAPSYLVAREEPRDSLMQGRPATWVEHGVHQ